jgi:hypothetical protein
MIKLILGITRKSLFQSKKSERSSQKSLRISCQSVLIPRKISGTFYAKSRENYMELEDNNEKFEGKGTRNLKKKHREFFSRVKIYNKKNNISLLISVLNPKQKKNF